MKLAAAVIIYHPDNHLLNNILSYATKVATVYAFDNTPLGGNTFYREELKQVKNLVLLADDTNKGIAIRLNQAAKMALADGFDWLLLMDQDSRFELTTFNRYLIELEKLQETNSHLALVGINNSPKTLADRREELPNYLWQDVAIITSGSCISLQHYVQTSGFDEALFIDGVDHLYALTMLSHNFSTVKLAHLYLTHPLGNMVKRASIKTLFIKKKEKAVHSALRCYYIYRNKLYIEKKFGKQFPKQVKLITKTAKDVISRSFFYGGEAMKIILSVIAAYIDFYRNNMGKKRNVENA